MQPLEIESLEDFDARVQGRRSIARWHLQALDLTGRTEVLARLDVRGTLFLGCTLAAEADTDVRARGALVFPTVPDVDFNPYRAHLYTPAELYDGLETGYPATLDAVVYAWSRQPRSLDMRLAEALHDHAVDDALDEFVTGCTRPLVGVMGGHAAKRGDELYRVSARLGQLLAPHFTVVTGGGPGAMEAANLGAWLDGTDGLEEALDLLAEVPDFHEVDAWARQAFAVRERWPDGCDNLGIPTWFYGHEPPNAFATHVAKYFRNALREDELLRICEGGIVFLPGAAGTVQEVFQNACGNYYAEPDRVSPMVLVGRDYWTRVLPAWQLLESLAGGRTLASMLHLVDSVEEVPALLLQVGHG